MLTIYGKSTSINVRKVLWTCAELQLPFDNPQWGAGHQRTDTPEFLAMNPNAMVPVLRDGDLILWESNAICRYLASQYGEGALLPREPAARARVEQWMDWQATELNNAWRYAFMGLVRGSAAHADAAQIAASGAAWHRHMAIAEAQLARTGAYLAGPDFTLADIVFGLSLNRWRMTPLDHPRLPALEDYAARLAQRAACMTWCFNGTP
ncbi:MAG TPA: glutathione S-transferase family protein [Burkholderiaceae bacterium]